MDVNQFEMGLTDREIKSMKMEGFTLHQIKVKEQIIEYRAFENFKAYQDWVNSGRPFNEKYDRNMKWQNDKLKKNVEIPQQTINLVSGENSSN